MRTRNIDAKHSWVTVLRVVVLLGLSGAWTLQPRGLEAAEQDLNSKKPRASAVPQRADLLAQVFGYGPPTADNRPFQSQLVSTDEKPAQTLEPNEGEAARDAGNEKSADGAVSEETQASLLTATDLIAIQQLNARYGVALDGLVADAAAAWADTFTPDGAFSIVESDGTILAEAQGTAALVELYGQFTDVATTRHWYNNLLIESDGEGAKMMSYVIAISIQQFPATIARSGIYKDRLVKMGRSWKFASRQLILDPGSPVG